MKVTIDTGSGFCFGVTSAIRKAEEELQHGPLFCLGDIVHNGQEVQRLKQMGLQTIDYDDLRTLHGGRVLLRAHGEPPSTYRIARDNRIEVIDASCPVVKKLQDRIRQTYEQHPNAQIVIFGQRGHAEVIGLEGQTANTALVVEKPEELQQIDIRKDIYLFSQTTKSIEEFQRIIDGIQTLRSQVTSPEEKEGAVDCPRFEWYNTICRNVANRVDNLKRFAQDNDAVVFVGGRKSSNAKVLFAHCRDANPRTVFVENASELDLPALLQDSPEQGSEWRIGICGATSTPYWLMEQCKNKILTYGQEHGI